MHLLHGLAVELYFSSIAAFTLQLAQFQEQMNI